MIDRPEAIKRIKKALKEITGRTWSVTGGRGTAWGWLTIAAPPRRRIGHTPNPKWKHWEPGTKEPAYFENPDAPKGERWYTSGDDGQTLGDIFDKSHGHWHQGISVSPDSREYYVLLAEEKAGGPAPTTAEWEAKHHDDPTRPYWVLQPTPPDASAADDRTRRIEFYKAKWEAFKARHPNRSAVSDSTAKRWARECDDYMLPPTPSATPSDAPDVEPLDIGAIYDLLPLTERTLMKRIEAGLYPFRIANDGGTPCNWYIYENGQPIAMVTYYKGRKLVVHGITLAPVTPPSDASAGECTCTQNIFTGEAGSICSLHGSA